MHTCHTVFHRRVGELESIMSRVEDSCKKEVEAITQKLQDKTTEIGTVRLDSERLKTSLASIEDKLKEKEEEVSTLRSGLKQYETLVSEYRDQVGFLIFLYTLYSDLLSATIADIEMLGGVTASVCP